MHTAYRTAIVYFTLFGLLLLASGTGLFAAKIGFTPESVMQYYHGGTESAAKSFEGLAEVAVPHLAGMGLFIMVTGHFMLFAPKAAKRKAVRTVLWLFAAALAEIAAGFFIAEGNSVFVWFKLSGFVLLILLGTRLCICVAAAAFRNISAAIESSHPAFLVTPRNVSGSHSQ